MPVLQTPDPHQSDRHGSQGDVDAADEAPARDRLGAASGRHTAFRAAIRRTALRSRPSIRANGFPAQPSLLGASFADAAAPTYACAAARVHVLLIAPRSNTAPATAADVVAEPHADTGARGDECGAPILAERRGLLRVQAHDGDGADDQANVVFVSAGRAGRGPGADQLYVHTERAGRCESEREGVTLMCVAIRIEGPVERVCSIFRMVTGLTWAVKSTDETRM
jgi:hypothetical protein